jgi:hypothetical protein
VSPWSVWPLRLPGGPSAIRPSSTSIKRLLAKTGSGTPLPPGLPPKKGTESKFLRRVAIALQCEATGWTSSQPPSSSEKRAPPCQHFRAVVRYGTTLDTTTRREYFHLNEDLPRLPTGRWTEHAGLLALRTPIYPRDSLDRCHGSVVCGACRLGDLRNQKQMNVNERRVIATWRRRRRRQHPPATHCFLPSQESGRRTRMLFFQHSSGLRRVLSCDP